MATATTEAKNDDGPPAANDPLNMEEFQNSFATESLIVDDDADDFDPFQIGAASTDDSKKKTQATGNNAPDDAKSVGGSTVKSTASSALPPRLLVKFQVHEEVSSLASMSDDSKGSSDVHIEGTLLAQIISSDALKNIPFLLVSSTENQQAIDFSPNDTYAETQQNGENVKVDTTVVNIPKDILGFVKVGTYRIAQSMEHMPLLLEQKVVRADSKIQIAIQVRSKLTNPDDLSDFTIAVSIPKEINGDSIEIASGEGEYDAWKRCVSWKLENLPKGQSFMVSAKCEVEETISCADEDLKFAVVMRCRSKDQMSSMRFQAVEAEGHPATISSSVVGKTYRILHRLN